MNYEVKFKKLSEEFGFICTLKDLDTESETIITAKTLLDLMELIQSSVEAHERIKAERCKVPLSEFSGQWKAKVTKSGEMMI